MKKIIIASLCIIFMFNLSSSANLDLFNKIKIDKNDLPEGFIFGKIPGFAKKVFYTNPCLVKDNNINFLINRLYYGGNGNNVAKVYVAIIANKETPFNDDIVCYVLQFKDGKRDKELRKIKEYIRYNQDRAVLLVKENIAIMIFADNIENYKYVIHMKNKILDKINM